MADFFTDYHAAYDFAVIQAKKYNREYQLYGGKEYARKGFYVRIAMLPQNRYGHDAEGEFIGPDSPIIERKK